MLATCHVTTRLMIPFLIEISLSVGDVSVWCVGHVIGMSYHLSFGAFGKHDVRWHFQLSKNTGVPGPPLDWRNLNLFGENLKPALRLLGARTPRNFLRWMGSCVECGKTQRGGVGLFYCNFLIWQEAFPPCGGVWWELKSRSKNPQSHKKTSHYRW